MLANYSIAFSSKTEAGVQVDWNPDTATFPWLLFAAYTCRQLVNLGGAPAQGLARVLAEMGPFSMDDMFQSGPARYGRLRAEIDISDAATGSKRFEGTLRCDPPTGGVQFDMHARGFGMLGWGLGFYAPNSVFVLLGALIHNDPMRSFLGVVGQRVGEAYLQGRLSIASQLAIAMEASGFRAKPGQERSQEGAGVTDVDNVPQQPKEAPLYRKGEVPEGIRVVGVDELRASMTPTTEFVIERLLEGGHALHWRRCAEFERTRSSANPENIELEWTPDEAPSTAADWEAEVAHVQRQQRDYLGDIERKDVTVTLVKAQIGRLEKEGAGSVVRAGVLAALEARLEHLRTQRRVLQMHLLQEQLFEQQIRARMPGGVPDHTTEARVRQALESIKANGIDSIGVE